MTKMSMSSFPNRLFKEKHFLFLSLAAQVGLHFSSPRTRAASPLRAVLCGPLRYITVVDRDLHPGPVLLLERLFPLPFPRELPVINE